MNMSSWHYQIRKRILEDKSKWYDIVESYNLGNGKISHTKEGMKPDNITRKGVIHVLEMMLKDAKKYKTLVE